jgi:DNA end-binding protein Ku
MAKRATPARRTRRRPSRGSHPRQPAANRRPGWAGQIRLALVSVPVLVFPATVSGARIAFHQVHKPSGKRIRYEKVVPGIGPVDTGDIFKGYEVSKGHYVLLDDAEINAVKLEARKTLELVQFVDHCEIDPIWFDRPYYVTPDGDLAEEAYTVLRDALRATRKVGIGQFVMRGREYIAALKPCGQGMMLETLRFADEVRSAAPLFADIDEGKTDKELLDLAETLIGKKTAPFKADVFKDQYTVALRKLVESKAKRRKPVEVEEEEPPKGGAQIIDLVEALKRSVRGAGREPAGGRRKAG